jgi:hypothetical protein
MVLLDSWKQVESLQNDWICDHESNPQTKSFQNSKDSDSQIFLESGFAKRIHVFMTLLYDSCNLNRHALYCSCPSVTKSEIQLSLDEK